MEKNVLQPQAEIKNLFHKHFQKLMDTYGITDFLLLTDLDAEHCLIRGSPEKIGIMLVEELEKNNKLRKIIVQFLRSSGMKKLFESEVKKHE